MEWFRGSWFKAQAPLKGTLPLFPSLHSDLKVFQWTSPIIKAHPSESQPLIKKMQGDLIINVADSQKTLHNPKSFPQSMCTLHAYIKKKKFQHILYKWALYQISCVLFCQAACQTSHFTTALSPAMWWFIGPKPAGFLSWEKRIYTWNKQDLHGKLGTQGAGAKKVDGVSKTNEWMCKKSEYMCLYSDYFEAFW